MEADNAATLPAGPAPEQVQELYRLMSGYRVSQAIYIVAALGIADLLADGPHDSHDLARATDTDEDALYRVLRLLVGVGLFDEVAPRRLSLTPLGVGLRADVPGSVRPQVLLWLDEYKWRPWGHLLHSVRTGETAFIHVHGMGHFDYLRARPETAARFNAAMTSNSARSSEALLQAYDFAGIARLVDVGGGHGLLLATILRAYPALRGVLFDLPAVVAGAPPVLDAAGVSGRCKIVAGDFFAAVPTGDAFILRQIIHDWDDAQATAILANCRRALAGRGKVLVMERGLASDYRQALPELHLDLEMMVNLGGRQRTDAEYDALFAAAGLRLNRVIPLGDVLHYSIFEGLSA